MSLNHRAPLPPDLRFLELLWSLDHELKAASHRMEAQLGLTWPQRLVIRLLGASGMLHAGELARQLHVHPSTLTGILARLESRRLIKRTVDAADARRQELRLTAAGAALDKEHPRSVEGAVSRSLKRVPAGQVSSAREVLLLITDALAGQPKPRSPPRGTARRRGSLGTP